MSRFAAAVFPIAGVGASAGGLEAFKELLRHLPDKPGLALIFVLHAEKHESALVDIVRRLTSLPVQFAADGLQIERDHIYIGEPETEITLSQGKLRVLPQERGKTLPIDLLFTSLAEDQGTRAIGVILSGSASDGALGTKAIKAEGGITFAQDESAQFSGMPRAALAAGAVDFVMSAAEIGRELARIARHAYMSEPGMQRFADLELTEVFALLQTAHEVDFSHYKPSTVERRIRRRMALGRIEILGDYVKRLREDSVELESLYNDILIRVTGFFRDPEVFAALQSDILPALMRERAEDAPVRVWVPGCATGEEVYSLAIGLLEVSHGHGFNCPIQIFGTDISDAAIDAARLGVYPDNISAMVSTERLRRFFTKAEGGYRVSKAVRDCCVFARQNLTRDSPFSRLDLISCRNVMIYLGSLLQRKVMSIFHYALRPNGYLLLGNSETIGNFADLFSIADRKHRIYQRKSGAIRGRVDFEAASPRVRADLPAQGEQAAAAPANVFREADRVLLSRFAPAGVLINEQMEILQFRGRTSPYLEPAPGAASFNVVKMAREGLIGELRTAIHNARKMDAPVRRLGVRVKNDSGTMTVNVEVLPFVGVDRDRYYLIMFEEVVPETDQKKKGKRAVAEEDMRQVARLKRELETTREYLQSIIEEQEAMNEELRSANEEIQSSNEELQSTNEELETAKEELQSSNEELTTLNEELENRAQELAEANDDLVNLLASVDIPIVMLDSGLRIRRFNPGAQRALNLIPSDAGRPLTDLKTTLVFEEFEQMVASVIEHLETREVEVQDRNGRWYLLRVRPYKTTENRIEGAVMVLIDVDQLRKKL